MKKVIMRNRQPTDNQTPVPFSQVTVGQIFARLSSGWAKTRAKCSIPGAGIKRSEIYLRKNVVGIFTRTSNGFIDNQEKTKYEYSFLPDASEEVLLLE